MYAKKNSGKKVVATLLAVVLLIGCGIGGTLAWLMDTTPTVANTFTVGDVELTLVESPYTITNGQDSYGDPAEGVNNSYPLIPGNTYKKDPKVTVAEDSEDCWLFVKMDEVNSPDTYLTYTFKSDGWTSLYGETGVYYREVKKSDEAKSWDLLTAGDNGMTVTVKDTIVKAGTSGTENPVMPADDKQPQLVFTAYAVQKANLTVEQAWEKVDPTPAVTD